MWKTDEWQRVEVPAGVYEIGVEIPAGEWTLSSSSSLFLAVVGSKRDETKTKIDRHYVKAIEAVELEDYKNGWTVELSSGDFIELSHVVYFTVPVKGQGFSFK